MPKKIKLQIPTSQAFEPLLGAARYKGAFGGRGSGKSHFFGEMMVEECVRVPGTRAVCIREFQSSLAQSSKALIELKIAALGRRAAVPRSSTTTSSRPGDGLIIFNGMQNHTAETIKSLEGCRIAWVEEAQTLSSRSLSLLRPTIRETGSEIWFSWNPRRKSDAVDEFLRVDTPHNAKVVCVNWKQNEWWGPVLEAERRLDLERYPDRYAHIWEGAYAQAFEGAYYSKQLQEAKAEGRIGKVVADPLLPLRAFFDLGGAGAEADAMAIWICQFVGQQIYVLDYIEGIGQVLAYYVDVMRSRGYQKAVCHLPHDGLNTNAISGKRYVDHLRDAGFDCEDPEPNLGRGAASQRIEAVRRIFSRCWFDDRTEPGRDALGFYHEKKHEERNIGLGPEHDWSSHAADAFGLMAVKYEAPRGNLNLPKRDMRWVA